MAEPLLLGTTSMGGNEEVLRVMQSLSESVEKLAGYFEKAGESAHTTGDYVKEMNVQQTQMITQIITYNQMINNVQQNTLNIKDNNLAILNTHKEISDELDKHQQKQQKIIEDSKRENEEELKRRQHRASSIGGGIAGAIENPVGSALGMLMKFAPEIGIVTMGADAALSKYREIEMVAKAGGGGISETFGGVGGLMNISIEKRMSSMLGLATSAESNQALATLIGKGGLRGKDLEYAFDGLAEAAKNAGMKVTEYANVLATLSKTGTARELPLITQLMKTITEQANKEGIIPKDAQQANTAMTMMSAAYAPYASTWLSTLSENITHSVDLEAQGLMNAEDRARIFAGGTKRGLPIRDVKQRLPDLEEATWSEHVSITDLVSLGQQITDKLLPYTKDYTEATKEGDAAAKKMTASMNHGEISINTFLSVFDDLHSKFGKNTDQIADTTKELDTFGKKIHYSGTDLGRTMTAVAGELLKFGYGPAGSLEGGRAAMYLWATELRDHKADVSDIVKIAKTQLDIFGVEGLQDVTNHMKIFKNIINSNIVRMDELGKFISENSSAMKRYGIDQAEGTALFLSMNRYLRDTTMSVQTFNDVLKGPAGAPEGTQALAFAKVVGMGGKLGEVAQAAGPLGFMELYKDVNQFVSSGKTSDWGEAGRRAFGTTDIREVRKMKEVIDKAVLESANEMARAAGVDPNTFAGKGMLRQFLGPLWGVSAEGTYGTALEAAGKAAQTGGALGLTQTQMQSAADAFGVPVGLFGTHVNTLGKILEALAEKENIPITDTPPPATDSGRKKQTAGPHPVKEIHKEILHPVHEKEHTHMMTKTR